jgi:hypothetical protein
MAMRSKVEMMSGLQRMLHDLFTAREAGVSYPKVARTQGHVDGYMRALLECGQASKQELLELVAAERSRVSGPAVREIAMESAADIAAA